LFFNDNYKQEVLWKIRETMQQMHIVEVKCHGENSELALQTIHLEMQDECVEGAYGLQDVQLVEDGSRCITLTPFFQR
jgi:hypothetical protein